jgi:DNA-binding NarL/FixJ family response regulator
MFLRTLIVEDHPLFRSAIGEVLQREPGFEVSAQVGTVAEAVECIGRATFDVAIVDLVLPDGTGAMVLGHVLSTQPQCKVLALSAKQEPLQIAAMLRAGASGFALKSQPAQEIVEALRAVAGGGHSVPAMLRDEIDVLITKPEVWSLERLTPREREVFDLIVSGNSNDHIAERLCISVRTVETHRLRVMNKLAAHSLGDLFQLAIRHGLVG